MVTQTTTYQSSEVTGEIAGIRTEERWAALIGGLLLLRLGLRPRGLFGIALAVIGADLLYRGITGNSHIYEALQFTAMPTRYLDSRYDHRDDYAKDIVDEASEQSFPASDPPSFTGG